MYSKDRKQFYSGHTTFMDSTVPFEIENNILRLYVERQKVLHLFFNEIDDGVQTLRSTPKPLDISNLKCYTNDGRYYLSVYFEKDRYGASNIVGTGNITIVIYFHHLIVTDLFYSDRKNSSFFLGISSKCFYKFLGMVPHYKMDDISKPNFSIGLDFPSNKKKTSIKYKNHCFEVYPKTLWTNSFSSLDYTPCLVFKTDSFVNEETVVSFVDIWIKMFKFLFMRNNVFPDHIRIMSFANHSDLYITHQKAEKDLVEKMNPLFSDSISWDSIYKYIPNLFSLMSKNDLYIYNLQDSISERLSVGIYTANLDAAAFEYEFSKLYPGGIKHKKLTIDAEEVVMNEIELSVTNSSGKKKDIYKKLQKYVKCETLQSKIEFAIRDRSKCLIELKNRFASGFSFNEVASICANFRNDIDHGNRHGIIDEKVVSSFIILRGLVYSIQLTRCGLPDNEINFIVSKLFSINNKENT